MWRCNGANRRKKAFQASVAREQRRFLHGSSSQDAGKQAKMPAVIVVKLNHPNLLNLGLW